MTTNNANKVWAIQWAVLLPMLIGLPLLGLVLRGEALAPYLQFPPLTSDVSHAPFSAVGFCLMAALIVGTLTPFMVRWGRSLRATTAVAAAQNFPWWGWVGVACGVVSWVMAWTRLPGFERLQMHTFTPLWMATILVVNALAYRRSGRCMLTHRTGFFLALFPVSAAFWWFFEYLNRFVMNWHYVGGVSGLNGFEYVVFATVPFATVLPAVLGTAEWLATYPSFDRAFCHATPLRATHGRRAAVIALAVAGLGLCGIAMWPEQLFPLVWVSPLLIVLAVQGLLGQPTLLDEAARGDWRRIAVVAVAALMCGFLWEMWNMLSLARWEYTIPFVHAGKIFEMPLLGYAGYLPFGLECLAVGDAVQRLLARDEVRQIDLEESHIGFDPKPVRVYNESLLHEGGCR